MKKFLLLYILFIAIYINSEQVDLIFPVQYKEGLGLSGINASFELLEPILEARKISAEFVAGLSSCELYANVKVSVIWDPDSVKQGDTLTVRIVAQPVPSDKPSIYSNFGFSTGVGSQIRTYGLFGGEWLDGPGIGFDFNINISENDTPPMGPYDQEYLFGDDVVDFLSLIPDVKGAGEGKAIILDNNGDTIKFNTKEGSSAGDVLGLFDFLSLKLSGGLKINDGHIQTKVFTGGPDEEYFSSNTQNRMFYNRTDTLYYKVYIDSFAPESSICYIYIQDPSYFVELFQRMGMQLESFGITLVSSYWYTKDKYDDKGVRELKMSDLISYWDRMKIVPIKVTGTPLYRPDYVFNWFYTIPYNYWGDYSDYFAEAQCTTQFKYSIINDGDTYAPECTLRIIIDKDTIFKPIPQLNVSEFYQDSIFYVFNEPGEYYINANINYNHQYEEYTYENNVYITTLPVVEPVKLLTFAFENDSSNLITTDSLLQVTVKSKSNLQTINWYSNIDYLKTKLPGEDTVLLSVLPDTINTNYYITSKYIDMNPLSITNDTIVILLNKYGKLTGTITNVSSEPIESVLVSLSSYSTYTDSNGKFTFNKIIPLPTGYDYSLSISHYKFHSKDTTIFIGSGDSIDINMQLSYQDTTPPTLWNKKLLSGYYNFGKYTTGGQFEIQYEMYDDFSGIRGIEMKNDTQAWQLFEVKNLGIDNFLTIDWLVDTTVSNNGWQKYYYRAVDLAYNKSDSILDSIYYVKKGPVGSLTILDSITSSPDIRLQLSAYDSAEIPIDYVKLNIAGTPMTINYTTSPVHVYLPASDGNYQVSCTYYNVFSKASNTYTKDVNYSYIGNIEINNNDTYTDTNNVNLHIVSLSALGENNASAAIAYNDQEEIVMQTFVPNTSQISAIGVNLQADILCYVDLYTVQWDSLGNIYPDSRLDGFTVPDGTNGWYEESFSNVINVNPSATYAIVISSSSSSPYDYPIVNGADDNSYTSGSAYYYDMNNDMYQWYGHDFLFKIYTPADSVEISNYSDMSNSIKYDYTTSNYAWDLIDSSGNREVFARFKYNSSWSDIIKDAIVLDKTSPVIDSLVINNHAIFTTVPNCTLTVYYNDDYSPTCSLFINNTQIKTYLASNNKIIVPFPDTVTCKQTINVRVKDMAGNISDFAFDSIDYDTSGLIFSANFNNGTSKYIPSRYPTLYIYTTKNISADSLLYGEDFRSLKTIPFTNTVQCTLSENTSFHQMIVKVKDNYNKVSEQFIWATVDSTPPPAIDSVWFSDNAVDGDNHVYWNGIHTDLESGLDNIYVNLVDYSNSNTVWSAPVSITHTDTILSGIFDLYNTYYFNILLFNNAGLYSEKHSKTFTVNDIPDSAKCIYPNNDSVPTLFDFSIIGYDKQTDTTLCYKIEISDTNDFSNIIKTFNGKTNTNNWSKKRYATGDTAIFTIPTSDSLYINTKYYYRIRIMDSISQGNSLFIDSFYVNTYSGIKPDYLTNINDYNVKLKKNIVFSKQAIFNIELPKSNQVSCNIYDSKGALVKSIFNNKLSRGGYIIKWDLTNNNNRLVSSGNYFIITNMGNKTFKEKLILLK